MVEVCALGVGFVASLCVFIRRGTPVGRLGGSEDGHGDALVLRWAAFVLLQRVCAEWVGAVLMGRESQRPCGYSFCSEHTSAATMAMIMGWERLWCYAGQISCFSRMGCAEWVEGVILGWGLQRTCR